MKSYLRLEQLKIGEHAIIRNVLGEGKIRRRLLDMGLTTGAQVYFRKVAPLGDPIEITVRGYELTLRKSEANLIVVEKSE